MAGSAWRCESEERHTRANSVPPSVVIQWSLAVTAITRRSRPPFLSGFRFGLGPDWLFGQLVAVDDATVAHNERQLSNIVNVGERVCVEAQQIGQVSHPPCR